MMGPVRVIWDRLCARADTARSRRITDLFNADAQRSANFSCDLDDLHFDYSKTNIDTETRADLLALAQASGLSEARDGLFSGAPINQSENRAVMHWALRAAPGPDGAALAGPDGAALAGPQTAWVEIAETRARMENFAKDLRAGRFTGQGGAITDVVNIGIGGSDLGPRMAARALSPFHDGPRVHFVSNVDGADISDTLALLAPATTLVIVASKTFTTLETMTNARVAQAWMGRVVRDTGAQFVALSSNVAGAADFGIDSTHVFGFGNYVGGRYSVWGPVGLSVMLAIGPARFGEFLAGGAAMDAHFSAAPAQENLPVMLALTGLWHRQGLGYASRAVLPYEERLTHLPAYLQQLEMESNGKSVTHAGDATSHPTGPVVWGAVGTNCQHSFMQLLHQGCDVVPCEFMVGAQGFEVDLTSQHRLLVANCLAQSRALMMGRDRAQTRAVLSAQGLANGALEAAIPARVFPGNRPSTTLIYPRLTPRVLGQIIALYEHRVFVEGVILGINSFDQWGVELGKEQALALQPVLEGRVDAGALDGSSAALVAYIARHAQDVRDPAKH